MMCLLLSINSKNSLPSFSDKICLIPSRMEEWSQLKSLEIKYGVKPGCIPLHLETNPIGIHGICI